MSSWWLFFLLGIGMLAIGVLMIVFRVQVARFQDWGTNRQWGFLLKTPVETPPVLFVVLAFFPIVFGIVFTLAAILNPWA